MLCMRKVQKGELASITKIANHRIDNPNSMKVKSNT